jgi:ABC-type branched-subunit amino acid transport system substrate-binding protein
MAMRPSFYVCQSENGERTVFIEPTSKKRAEGFSGAMATLWFLSFIVALGSMVMFACAQQPIKIGRTISVCGQFEKESAYITKGVEFWLEDVNARGGLLMSDGSRRPVQLITYSDGSDATTVEILYDWLINQDKVR